jgi:hypothetical protein
MTDSIFPKNVPYWHRNYGNVSIGHSDMPQSTNLKDDTDSSPDESGDGGIRGHEGIGSCEESSQGFDPSRKGFEASAYAATFAMGLVELPGYRLSDILVINLLSGERGLLVGR